MPIPLATPTPEVSIVPVIDAAIDSALLASGAIARVEDEVKQALIDNGLTIPALVTGLANLAYSGKETVRLRAIERGMQLHGINLAPTEQVSSTPTFVFNIRSENANINQLFAPER